MDLVRHADTIVEKIIHVLCFYQFHQSSTPPCQRAVKTSQGWANKKATLRWVLRWVRREPQTSAMNQLNVSLQHSIVTLSAALTLMTALHIGYAPYEIPHAIHFYRNSKSLYVAILLTQ